VCQQTFPRQTTAADALIAEIARMLVAVIAPNATLLIARILDAPFVPRCKPVTDKSCAWFRGLEKLRQSSMRCGTREFAAMTISKPGVFSALVQRCLFIFSKKPSFKEFVR
jgi:hypothetical protein